MFGCIIAFFSPIYCRIMNIMLLLIPNRLLRMLFRHIPSRCRSLNSSSPNLSMVPDIYRMTELGCTKTVSIVLFLRYFFISGSSYDFTINLDISKFSITYWIWSLSFPGVAESPIILNPNTYLSRILTILA